MLHIDQGRAAALNFLSAHGGLLVCGLFLLAGLGLAGEYGVGVDEVVQRSNARANLHYILGPAERVVSIRPQDQFYGVVLELPLLLAERSLGLEDYYYIHRIRLTVTHLLFLVGGFFCYLLAYRLFNNRLIALFALLLFLLHPRIYAHSFFNAKDLPFLSMFVIALYLTERAFRKNTLGAFLLLGMAVGIATNFRIMGLMLFAAVIGMRVLDAALSQGWGERRRLLATGGMFLTASGLVWYGVTPNAWSDPLAHLTGELSLAADHPTILNILFRGEWIRSDELPAHYGLTWFMITTPPPALLLGVVGLAVALARGLARPGAVLVNGRGRFWLLLAGCFGLPLLAVALASSNIYSEWRLLYFIYVPFALLAAGGLYWAASALSGRRWQWAGVYGLAGLGLGLTLLQMAQLHPWQHLYFNFLVDRTAPNQLRTQYETDSRLVIFREGLEYALGRHPGERVAVPEDVLALREATETLASADRRRLRLASAAHDPDYALSFLRAGFNRPLRPDVAFNSGYPPLYNNTVLSLRALDSSRMDAAAAAGYMELYRAAVAGKPIIRGEYAVYLTGRMAVFVKEDCQPGERAGQFGVKVYPAAAAEQPGRIPGRDDYRYLSNAGARLGNKCLAAIRLPDYPIAYLAAGRYVGPVKSIVWEGAHSFIRPGLAELAVGLGKNRPGTTPGAGFELYRQEELLIYYREGCQRRDTAARFSLHIVPENMEDLPPERREAGFENRGFYFSLRGINFDGQCLATAPLPDYPIAEVRTGQEGYWEFSGIPPVETGFLRERAAALAGAAADYRGEFDLYWRDGELIYRREVCAAADTAAGFFLHITPVNGADLAAARREYGFESRDFEFARWGGHFDGGCLAVVDLPGYAIAGMRTGQYAAGTGEVWSAELGPPPRPKGDEG